MQIQATDSDDPTAGFTFSATGLPAGLAINASTGLISGTATTPGYNAVSVTATDSVDASESGQVGINWFVHSVIVFTQPKPQNGAIGDSVQLQTLDSGAVPGYALSYAATGLPPDLSIGCATGLISGWLWTPGTYHVTVSAHDALGSTGSTTFIWTVALPADRGATGHVRLDPGHMCLNDAGNRSANGTPIQIWSCDSRRSEVWTVVQDETIRIHGKCLSVDRRRVNSNGAKIVLSSCTGSPNQRWVNLNGDLGNRASGQGPFRCLTDPRGSMRNGTQLEIWMCNTGGDSEWTGPAEPILSLLPRKCVDDRGNQSAAGTAIQIWTCNGTAAQKWTVGPGLGIQIHGKCLGTRHDRMAAGTPVRLEPCDGSRSQTWIVAPSSASFTETLWNGASDATWCIADPGASEANGTQLILSNCFTSEPGDFWHIP